MKYFAVVLALSCALLGIQSAPTSSRLLDDLKEINSFFVRDNLIKLIVDYDHNDPQVHEIFKYFKSEEMAAVTREFSEKPEVVEFIAWLMGKLPQGSFANSFDSDDNDEIADVNDSENDDVLSDVETREREYDSDITGGWHGFLNDYMRLFPIQEFVKTVQKLKAEDKDLVEMWKRLSKLKPVYDEFIREPEVIKVERKLRELGVDLQQLDGIIRIMNGWY